MKKLVLGVCCALFNFGSYALEKSPTKHLAEQAYDFALWEREKEVADSCNRYEQVTRDGRKLDGREAFEYRFGKGSYDFCVKEIGLAIEKGKAERRRRDEAERVKRAEQAERTKRAEREKRQKDLDAIIEKILSFNDLLLLQLGENICQRDQIVDYVGMKTGGEMLPSVYLQTDDDRVYCAGKIKPILEKQRSLARAEAKAKEQKKMEDEKEYQKSLPNITALGNKLLDSVKRSYVQDFPKNEDYPPIGKAFEKFFERPKWDFSEGQILGVPSISVSFKGVALSGKNKARFFIGIVAICRMDGIFNCDSDKESQAKAVIKLINKTQEFVDKGLSIHYFYCAIDDEKTDCKRIFNAVFL